MRYNIKPDYHIKAKRGYLAAFYIELFLALQAGMGSGIFLRMKRGEMCWLSRAGQYACASLVCRTGNIVSWYRIVKKKLIKNKFKISSNGKSI